MESDWVKIYSTTDHLQLEILREKLMESDIPSAVINKQDSMHIHLNSQIMIELYVAKNNAFQAVQIIEKTKKS
ncbi:DUF2007 domain-containing protein [bacterium SCSIO 12741]|nr:DUF2007 domain-containing protein [bacterium SCSIO 12741]